MIVARVIGIDHPSGIKAPLAEIPLHCEPVTATTRLADDLGDFTATPRLLLIAAFALGIGVVSAYVAVSGDASPAECRRTFTTGCQAAAGIIAA